MRWRMVALTFLVTIGLAGVVPSTAEAAVKWNGSIVYVTENLPASWDVAAAVNWLDLYTASDMRIVKACPAKAYRCIHIRVGRLTTGAKAARAAWTEHDVITVDVWKTQNVRGWKGYYGYYTKRWLVTHELGHEFGLNHVQNCATIMDWRTRCKGNHIPPRVLNASQRAIVGRW